MDGTLTTFQIWTYEKDGALWLDTTRLLKEKYMREGKTQEQVDKLDLKDDVLRRANGFYTYFAADIAYHRNKLEERGFDLAINIWGADHHGHVARLQAALDGLGLDGSHRLVIVLMQLVNLMQDGKPVRMSKRSGKAIALHDLLDEISSGRGPVLLHAGTGGVGPAAGGGSHPRPAGGQHREKHHPAGGPGPDLGIHRRLLGPP